MRFTEIRPTAHYLASHAREVPWHEVVEAIFLTKGPWRKGDKFEIENGALYVLFEVSEGVIHVINAKRQ